VTLNDLGLTEGFGFRLTETLGADPNYYTLHCHCGDGFIWRTDDTSESWREWHRLHNTDHGRSVSMTSAPGEL